MALIDDINTLLTAASTAIAADDGATAQTKLRQALVLSATLPNVIQHGGERIERQQIVSAIKEALDQAAEVATTASSTSGAMRFTRLTHKEPSAC